jgi:osmotically inducible protein OsmC
VFIRVHPWLKSLSLLVFVPFVFFCSPVVWIGGSFDIHGSAARFRGSTNERKIMADIQRQASVHWSGELMRGSGKISTGSGVLRDVPYSVPSRFENGKGTNPEELIAAAHASCFSMMLAKLLGDAKKTPRDIQTKATLTLSNASGGWKISKIHLETDVSAEGLDAETLNRTAAQAKEQCPISVLLKPGLESLTLDVRLKS